MVRSYLSRYHGTRPWTEGEIYDAARACWKNSGGDVVMIRISDLTNWAEKDLCTKIGARLYGEIQS